MGFAKTGFLLALCSLTVCHRPIAIDDLPGRYCSASAALPDFCFTLQAGGEVAYERKMRKRLGGIPPGRWSIERSREETSVTLSNFPMDYAGKTDEKGFQVLIVEKTFGELRLYADYDSDAYYAKRPP